MSQPESGSALSRQILSALADGEATQAEGADAFAAWREDAEVCATWHCYHLIGDVMRSEDLAVPGVGHQRLLAALRERLAGEPVVLAPQAAAPPPAEAPGRLPAAANASAGGWLRAHWQAPVAMAAGFLAVIGGLQLARGPAGSEAGPAAGTLARAGAASGNVLAIAGPPGPAPAPVARTAAAAPTGAVGRDQADQIAPYLAAHRLATMNAAFQMPGGGDLRNAAMVDPGR